MQPFASLKRVISERRNFLAASEYLALTRKGVKRMKKLVSIISALSLAAAFCVPVLAENNNEAMENALRSVKERIEIPAECTEFSSGSHEAYGIKTYNFSWHTKDAEEYKYVDAACLEDGTITEYSTTDTKDTSAPKIPTLSKTDAKEIAEVFIESINPEFPYEIKLNDSFDGSIYSNAYRFGIEVYVNGILFEDGTGSVAVNSETGKVTHYYMNYVPVEFPSVEEAISVEEAKKAYSEKLGLKLVYKTYTDDDNNEKAYPAYVQKNIDNTYINALTGDTITLYDGEDSARYQASGGAMKEMATANDAGFTPQEMTELENVKGLISKADIEKQIKGNKTLGLSSDTVVTSTILRKQYNKDEYRYEITMLSGDESIYTSLDAKTGEILSYYRYGDDKNDENCQNDKTLKALAGDKADEYEYDADGKYYQRYVNGIPVEDDIVSIAYSDGTLTQYSISYTDVDFPALDEVISAADAEKAMFDINGYEISYVLNNSDNALAAVPVYAHDYININAFTGKAVTYNDEEVSDNEGKIEYSDIDNHYAKEIIKTLAYYGIGFDGGEFKPDEKITQKDYISLLTTLNQSPIVIMEADGLQYDRAYSSAIRQNIISADERDDNAIVTREMAAVYLIRAIGAEQFAKYDSIYVTAFKDVTQYKGYIALLNAMGIVSGNGDGTFTPQREITRAESAVMIYNYLTRQ